MTQFRGAAYYDTFFQRMRKTSTGNYQASWFAWGHVEYVTKTLRLRGFQDIKVNDRLVDVNTGDTWSVSSITRGEDELMLSCIGGTPVIGG